MTDTPEDQLEVPDISEATAAPAIDVPEIYEMSLDVTIDDAGPCRKHVKVTVPRKDIDHHFEETVEKFRGEADVPGFRPGMVPAQLIQKRFKKELASQVKQDILLESLEQISEKNDLDPINQPDIDINCRYPADSGHLPFLQHPMQIDVAQRVQLGRKAALLAVPFLIFFFAKVR